MNPTRGFTLIELIALMVILGLMAIVAVPQIFSPPTIRAHYVVRKMQSDIRYAQLLAMQRQEPVLPLSSTPRIRVVFNLTNPPSSNGYQLEQEVGITWILLTHPATRSDYVVNLNTGDYQGVSITTISLNAGNAVIFDSYGRPFIGSGSPLTEPAYVDVNGKYRLNFRAQTGKVDITNL